MLSGILISQTDRRPLYLQIMEQIKRRVAVGDWPPGQPIPSIRQLAVELNVSVITTQHGKGSMVAAHTDLGSRIQQQDLARHLEQAVQLAALLGLSTKELELRLREARHQMADAQKERS